MLDKTYSPKDVEPRIYDAWQASGAFQAGRSGLAPDAEPFCIVIPPPNVTGSLHMGHALNNTIQDILCRYWRMRGRDVLWQPGMDHAGYRHPDGGRAPAHGKSGARPGAISAARRSSSAFGIGRPSPAA